MHFGWMCVGFWNDFRGFRMHLCWIWMDFERSWIDGDGRFCLDELVVRIRVMHNMPSGKPCNTKSWQVREHEAAKKIEKN